MNLLPWNVSPSLRHQVNDLLVVCCAKVLIGFLEQFRISAEFFKKQIIQKHACVRLFAEWLQQRFGLFYIRTDLADVIQKPLISLFYAHALHEALRGSGLKHYGPCLETLAIGFVRKLLNQKLKVLAGPKLAQFVK